jgi:hypothetical protein
MADDVQDSRVAGPVARFLFGWIIRRLVGPSTAEATVRPFMASPNRYIPDPGQEPAPAEIITDPGLAERLPGLLSHGMAHMPAMPRSTGFSFSAKLEEDGDMLIVSAFPERMWKPDEGGNGHFATASWERIGRLSPADADVYRAHLRTARLRGQSVVAVVSGRKKGRRLRDVTVRI